MFQGIVMCVFSMFILSIRDAQMLPHVLSIYVCGCLPRHNSPKLKCNFIVALEGRERETQEVVVKKLIAQPQPKQKKKVLALVNSSRQHSWI